MLEFDTTDNKFRDDLLTEPLYIQHQFAKNGGHVPIPDVPGHGAEPNREFLEHFAQEDKSAGEVNKQISGGCLLYTSPIPRDS